MPAIKINNTNLLKIELPESGVRVFYWDTELKGFGVKATTTGLYYVTRRRIGGRKSKDVRHVIGKHGEISASEARNRAASALAELRDGIDLNEQRRTIEKEQEVNGKTLGQAYAEFMSSRTLRPRTVETYEENINRTLKDWLGVPLVSITKDMVKKRHEKLSSQNGPRGKGVASANQAMRLLRVIFNYAMATYDNEKGQPLITENPVRILSQLNAWNKLEPRDNIIQEDDLASWYEATMALDNDVLADYILFLMFTGLRRSECMRLQWSYVDTKKSKVLTLPADITKTGKKRQLPLTDVLMEILERRRAKIIVGNPYVFTGRNGIKHLVEPRRGINTVRKNTDITWSLHDLRRTYATIASRLDISYYKLKTLLGHSVSGDVTSHHYVQVDVESLRPEMQKITNYLKNKMKMTNSPQSVSNL